MKKIPVLSKKSLAVKARKRAEMARQHIVYDNEKMTLESAIDVSHVCPLSLITIH
jgi:hypothetical protein